MYVIEEASREYESVEGEQPSVDNPVGLVLAIDATDLREESRVAGESQNYKVYGGEDAGNLADLASTSGTRLIEADYKAHASAIDIALKSPELSYSVDAAAALLQHAIANLPKLKSVLDEKSENLAKMRLKYQDRNGGVTSELFGVQKTWVSMLRRLVDIARAGAEACANIITTLTPGAATLEMIDFMNLSDWVRSFCQALITPASHYMPIMLSTLSNRISIVVGRIYFKAISNVALFSILDRVGETLRERSGETVVVEVETFDGAHRARIQGGGQYWAHRAEEKVRFLTAGLNFASPQSMLGKAQRVEKLCERAIELLLKGPSPTPTALTAAGIFSTPTAVKSLVAPVMTAALVGLGDVASDVREQVEAGAEI